MYDLLLDNYFNIIRNKEQFLIIPPPLNTGSSLFTNQLYFSSPQNSTNKEFFQSTQPSASSELYVKSVVVMPPMLKQNEHDEESDEAIKRWLMAKFFHFDSKSRKYETKHLENLCVNTLKASKFSLKFCIKLCADHMSPNELEKKRLARSLYGANSLIFVLMPFVSPSLENEEDSFMAYVNLNRRNFFQILALFDENLKQVDLNAHEFMFISYLEDNEQTKFAIEHILGSDKLHNYCYCLLEGDAVKDNGVLQRTYQFFLQKISLKYASVHFMASSGQSWVLEKYL